MGPIGVEVADLEAMARGRRPVPFEEARPSVLSPEEVGEAHGSGRGPCEDGAVGQDLSARFVELEGGLRTGEAEGEEEPCRDESDSPSKDASSGWSFRSVARQGSGRAGGGGGRRGNGLAHHDGPSRRGRRREGGLRREIQGGEISAEFGEARGPSGGVLRQPPEEDPGEFRGQVLSEGAGIGGRIGQLGLEETPHVFVGEGQLARGHGVEADRPGVEVAAHRGPFAPEELGGHVGGRAHDQSRGGEGRGPFVPSGQAEVGHAERVVGGDEDVVRLEIPVEDALPVGMGHGRAEGEGPAAEEGPGEGRAGPEDPAERAAVHVLRHEEGAAVSIPGVVETQDGGMFETGQGAGLLEETEEGLLAHRFGQEELRRHEAVEGTVPREPDRAHGPCPQGTVEVVARPELGPHGRPGNGHGSPPFSGSF